MVSNALPYSVSGIVVRGFGRGSRELGIPTANVPEEVVDGLPHNLPTGIYYGLASVNDQAVYGQVTSIGWNPFYNNVKKSVETHILHNFPENFYGSTIKVVLLGYIRPEKNFDSLNELIDAIHADIEYANNALKQEKYFKFKNEDFFKHNIKYGHGVVETKCL